MDEYWKQLSIRVGRDALYVDTGAILCYFEKGEDAYKRFFDDNVGYKFITSTYVLSETVRRLVKGAHPQKFVGPQGEICKPLSLHVLRTWLIQHNVYVICLEGRHFDEAKDEYCNRWVHGCDLVDVISSMIVKRLELREICSPDREDFGRFGIQCLP